MRKLILLIFTVFILIPFSGCHTVSEYNNDSTDLNGKITIYDNNKALAEIELFGNITQTNDGFVYSKYTNDSSEMEYYRFIFDTQKSIKLGSLKGWSFESNETAYVNNHIYFLAATGEIASYDDRTLKFMEIDLNNNTMREISSEKGGFPYDTLEKANDSVLMTKVLQNGSCLEEYNTVSGETKILKSFDFDDKNSIGEAIRKISVNEKDKTISLLMLKITSEGDTSLYIDTYDYDMNLLDTTDISSISEDENELAQGVSFFDCSNDCIFYENFSITRFLGFINNGTLDEVGGIDESFEMSRKTAKDNETYLFYRFADSNNYIYLFNTKDKTMKKAAYKAEDDRYYITNMSCDENNNLFIFMNYKHPDTGEQLEPRVYYVKMDDLKFE